jgi:hypothetical protein
MFECRSS